MPRSYATGGGSKPGGSNTDVQYNDGGSFGGDANLTWDKGTKILTVPTVSGQPDATLLLEGADSTATGGVRIKGGDANGGGLHTGGDVLILPGAGSSGGGSGGSADLSAGTGGTSSGNGGAVNLRSGDGGGPDGNSGDITVTAGNPAGAGTTGNLIITTANATLDTSYMTLLNNGLITHQVFDPIDLSSFVDLINKNLTVGGFVSLDWGSGFLQKPGGNVSVDYANFQLHSADSNVSEDWDQRLLVRSTSQNAVAWEASLLQAADGSISEDWDQRLLYDNQSGPIKSVDWSNRKLIDATGTNTTVDWNAEALYASDSTQSVDWNARLLYNTTGGGTTVDWLNKILYDNGGGTNCINWGSRQLIASDGSTVVLDWSSTTPVFHGQFADNETPSGTINSSNVTFTLANSPSPAASLQLIYNGQFQLFGTDYTLSGNTITFTTPPDTGTWIRAYYRY